MKIHALVLLALVACDKEKESTPTTTSASVTVAPPPPATTSAPAASSAASTTDEPPMDPKAVMVTIKDVDKDGTSKTVKAAIGGTVTLFLPDSAGATWAVDQPGGLGKAKEETMPGFAPGINAHQFQWSMKAPLKAGETHKVTFSNKKAGKTFTLTIELIS